MSKIQLGVTLYSYTKEYISGQFTLEDCIRECHAMGLSGYEIVGAQMVMGYPYVRESFLQQLREFEDKYGVRPVCYGANTDRGMLHDRDLNERELLASTHRDIRTAQKLGCKVMRAQFLLSPELLYKIAPYAEEYDVKVGIEIHNPETPSTPIMLEYLDAIERSKSKYIGFVPDLGCFADKPNIDSYEGALSRGANKALLDEAVQMRYEDVPMPQAEMCLKEKGADAQVMKSFYEMYGFLIFRKEPDLEGLKRILPYCFHFHGKFHHMNEDGTEASIPYEKILPVIRDSDFEGYIVSEYEGHSNGRAVEMVKKHIEMERRLLGLSS